MILLLLLLLLLLRLCLRYRHRFTPKLSTCSIAIFLGSGGHTAEALALLSSLDFARYTPRTYIITHGDHLSADKAAAFESSKATVSSQYSILTLPRARNIHQSLLTTFPTAFLSLCVSIYHLSLAPFISPNHHPPDVLLLNGPGTCFTLCIAVYLNRFLGLPAPKMIYIESFARVQSLSLSARLLRPLVDRFVVQWPQLLQDRGRGECHGCLV